MVIVADAGILRAESAGGNGAHGVANRLEDGHVEEDETEGADRGQAQVDFDEGEGDVTNPRGPDVRNIEARLVRNERAASHAEEREDGDEDDEDTDPTKPLRDRAPEEDGAGERFDVTHDGRSSCGEAGSRLENGIEKPQSVIVEEVGQHAEETDLNPAQANDENSFATKHLWLAAGAKEVEDEAETNRNAGGFAQRIAGAGLEEGAAILLMIPPGKAPAEADRDTDEDREDPEDLEYDAEIHQGATSLRNSRFALGFTSA